MVLCSKYVQGKEIQCLYETRGHCFALLALVKEEKLSQTGAGGLKKQAQFV